MKRIILLLLLFSNYLTAQQWQPTSIRQRFVNGIGIPTRDTLPGALSDSSQLVLRPQDSIVYYKYKGYWRALGGGAAAFTSTLQHEVKAGEAITKGQAVYVTSADGTNMIVSKASNATEATSSKTLGLIASTLATNGKGYVITEGLLAGLNTSTATAGDAVWLGTGGNLIYGLANKPTAPAHLVFIGIVTRSNSNNGEIFVKPQNGFELNEIHDVAINSPRNQSILLYDSVAKLWRDTLASVITANKVNISDTAAMLTPYLRSNVATATYEPKITAGTTAQYWRGDKSWQTLPVYTLAGLGGQPQLNGTGFVKASGTTISYDNSSYYLASNPNGYTSNTGTVTSIATTAPLTGGTITTSGTLGITQATASTSGFLSSTDWNTFNGKQNAITNPTTGTGTTNYVTKWTGTSALGNSQIFDNGTNVGIGTASPLSLLSLGSSVSAQKFLIYDAANNFRYGFGIQDNELRQFCPSNGFMSFGGVSTSDGSTFSERLRITSSGNVGIGSTSPDAKLRVSGLSNGTQAIFGVVDGRGLEIATVLAAGTNEAGSILNARGAGSGTLILQTEGTERMRITSSGNVGIGTTSPAATLDVTGTGKYSSLLSLNGGNIDGSLSDVLSIGNGTYPLPRHKFKSSTSSGIGGNILALNIATSNSTDVEVIRFTGNGNVGIGTTSPAEKLSVAGRLLVNTNTTDGANALQVNGSAKVSSLAGTGERLVAADASGKLVVSANISSGYYTPTITLINGIASATASPLIYTNINGIVTVTGKITINSNSITEGNQLEINLPASNPNVSPNSVGGCGVEITTTPTRNQDVLNFNSAFNYAKIAITFKSNATGSKVYTFTFSYDSNYFP
jgi:hypothetical protein